MRITNFLKHININNLNSEERCELIALILTEMYNNDELKYLNVVLDKDT